VYQSILEGAAIAMRTILEHGNTQSFAVRISTFNFYSCQSIHKIFDVLVPSTENKYAMTAHTHPITFPLSFHISLAFLPPNSTLKRLHHQASRGSTQHSNFNMTAPRVHDPSYKSTCYIT
jgi:hypothetical protein